MTRHRLDLFSLLSGLTLTGIALVALVGVSADVAVWVWPTLLIGVGVVVLATVLGSDRTATDEEVDEADRSVSPAGPTARDGTGD